MYRSLLLLVVMCHLPVIICLFSSLLNYCNFLENKAQIPTHVESITIMFVQLN